MSHNMGDADVKLSYFYTLTSICVSYKRKMPSGYSKSIPDGNQYFDI